MWERIEPRLTELGRRAGMRDVPPAVIATALLLAALAVGWAAWRWWPTSTGAEEITAPAAVQSADPAPGEQAVSVAEPPTTGPGIVPDTPEQQNAQLTVHVAGQVRRPGVYELEAGSRVIDGVEAAGGLVGDAAPESLNLARPLSDGEQVYVPSTEDAEAGRVQPAGASGVQPGSGSGPSSASAAQVNVNSADAAALETLPGVGPATAQKIITDREANGPFASVEDLGRVSGIGPKRIEQLKDLVVVR